MKRTTFIKPTLLAMSISLGFYTGLAKAETILVPNGDFEQISGTNNIVTKTNANCITGWVFSGTINNYGALYKDSANSLPEQGNFVAFINTDSPGDNPTQLTSAESLATIAANTTYTLTVSIGNPTGTSDTSWANPANLTIGLLADDVEIGTPTAIPIGTIPENSDGTHSQFQDFTFSFTTGDSFEVDSLIGQSLKIQITSVYAQGRQSHFDNIFLEAVAIPEPSTWALLLGGIGLLTMTIVWQRRQVN
ncbi:MAG: PEP-CTERM sorting domain-containing protein [Verrucomicrobiales bacterium]|jgi:hypothetical protein|nr:PEP-CTERM sorting domain-containing protein [Verrucomicrobiales bacterium]